MEYMEERKYVKDYSTFEQEYIELIHSLQKKNPVARIKDIARLRQVASPTVTVAVDRLKKSGLVEHEKSGYVVLTDEGKALAGRLERRHQLIQEFLHAVLGVEHNVAEEDACSIEHLLNKQSVDGLERFLEFARNPDTDCNGWLEKFKNMRK
jgi:DtxR family transcriptional regulator, Mn-dependent transcriptional regulator